LGELHTGRAAAAAGAPPTRRGIMPRDPPADDVTRVDTDQRNYDNVNDHTHIQI